MIDEAKAHMGYMDLVKQEFKVSVNSTEKISICQN